jgi:hypothetical protein
MATSKNPAVRGVLKSKGYSDTKKPVPKAPVLNSQQAAKNARNLPKAGDSLPVAVGKQWANAKNVTRASKAKENSRDTVLKDQASARNRSSAASKSGKK